MTPLRLSAAILVLAFSGTVAIAAEIRASDLVGLWYAERSFGPDVRGPLVVRDRAGILVADIAGFSVPVAVRDGEYKFELPDGKGSFRGHRTARGDLAGFWAQPLTVTSGARYATPVTIRREGATWRGEVKPLDDRFSYYVPVSRADDGSLSAYLRNPERNDGVFSQVKSVALDSNTVKLVGNLRRSKEQKTLYEGRIDDGVFTLPMRGGYYDFHKVDGDATSGFYPRGGTPERYHYSKPLQRDDGWPTATLEEVGISRAGIEAFMQKIVETPTTSVSGSQIHSVLIARHGKLVFEEYFHGHHRDRPHDTRSAAKSLASVLVGAAMQAGIKVGPETLVYQTMLGTLPPDLDPRKRAMKLEDLLMMRGGHFCDDNNDDAPGNENTMQEQTREPDWFRFILALPMDRTPGEKTIYCSIDAHLAGGVVAKAAGEPWADLFDRLVARPLEFGQYHLFLAPTGEAYNGGGAHLLSRDFLKVAQLMVNDGVWKGRQILSKEWARKSTGAIHDLTPRQQYGYLWNSAEYPYRDRKVRAFFAAGNGGQVYMGIPDLDLAIAFTAGNYADAAALIPQRVMVPEQILPAVTP